MHHWLKLLSQHFARLPAPVQRVGLGVLLGSLVALVILARTYMFLGHFFDRLEQSTLDFRYDIKINHLESRPVPIEKVAIVDIDARSVFKLGRFGRWPRSYHAVVVEYLKQGGAKAIGLDILFAGEEEPEQDQRLTEAVTHAGNVYAALSLVPVDSLNFLYPMDHNPYELMSPHSILPFPQAARRTLYSTERIEGPYPDLARHAKALVAVNTWPDQDGVHRAIPLVVNFTKTAYPTISLRMAMDALDVRCEEVQLRPGQQLLLGQHRTIPIDEQGRMLLHYYGQGGPKGQTFRYVSYYDVYSKNIPAEFFQDKIVLIGSSLLGQGDLVSVPFGAAFPGVELHATAIQNIVAGDFLTKTGLRTTVLIVLGLSVLISILSLFIRPLKGATLTLNLMIVYFVVAVVLFVRDGLWVEVIRPEGAILLSYVAPLMYRYFTEERERRHLKRAFQQYISPLVVEEIIRDPSKLNLGGEKRVVTILFSDLAGFTSVSETLSPENVCLLLNDYLTEMTDIILRHDGMIDKYEGDLILAIFGAPAWREDHAVRACRAALDMQARLAQLRAQWVSEGKPPLYARTGINTGEVIVGNMGSKTRMDYTVIGDNANLASRLEGANKQYGTSIMISEATYEQVRDHIHARELDMIRVKGKQQPVAIYEVLGWRGEMLPPDRGRVLDDYRRGLRAYRERRWDDAEAAFTAALALNPNDGPSQAYLRRCEAHRLHPPPPDWDGVFQMETK